MIVQRKLQVGDVVYQIAYGGIELKLTIERVTATMAFAKHVRLRREVAANSGFVKEVAGYNFQSFYLENEELKEKYKRELAISECKEIDVDLLSTETILAILDLVK